MSELTIKLENLQCTLTDPVSAEDIRAAWSMVDEIIVDIRKLETTNAELQEALKEILAMESVGRVQYAVLGNMRSIA